MAATVTSPTLSTTWTVARAEVEANFSDLVSKFGSIDNSDIAANAGIAPTKLSAGLVDVFIQLSVRAESLAGGWPGGLTVLDAVPIPGSNGDTAWVASDVSWVCSDTGGSVAAFAIELGEFNSGGVWAPATVIVGAATITNATAANDGNDGKALENASISLGYATTPKSIALIGTGADAATLSAAGSFFRATVRIRRLLQSA